MTLRRSAPRSKRSQYEIGSGRVSFVKPSSRCLLWEGGFCFTWSAEIVFYGSRSS